MNLTPEFYENLTADKLEEFVEFVEWPFVPDHLITDELKEKLSCIPKLKLRIWFKEILNCIEMQFEEESKNIFFFIGDQFYMYYDNKKVELMCSYSKIWSIFRIKNKINDIEAQYFIKNMMEQHFKNMVITPAAIQKYTEFTDMERKFNNMVVATRTNQTLSEDAIEEYFKKMVITSI